MEEASMRSRLLTGVIALLGTAAFAADGLAETIFLSTQLRPIEEAQKVRNVILEGFPDEVEFIPEDAGPFLNRIRAEAEAGSVTVGVIGALHGDLPPVQQHLDSLDDVMAKLDGRGFAEAFVKLGRLGGERQLYVPWMQATYIMAAHKSALEHLPAGADVNALTYAQLAEWGRSIQAATGERKLGFPAGPKGLMHRFFQGYLYPSYTGGVVRTFKSADAEAMWADFKALWAYVNPRSASYDFMQEPLLAGEVLVAFDHTARLMDALRQKPDEFVAFPAPSAGKGRGFMPVLAGLAVPKGAPDRDASARLIDYLTRPEVQTVTLREVAFFPVVEAELPDDLPQGVRLAAAAIAAQSGAADALPSLLPIGLGEKGGEFNKVYLDTFQRIVIRGQDIKAALETEGGKLAQIMAATGAPCWAPDPPSDGPCPVE
jgi:multiple sugar transport system substrate-binding protein